MRFLLLLLLAAGCTEQETEEPPIVAALHEKRIEDAAKLLRARVKSGAPVLDPVTLNRGYRGLVPDPDDTTDFDKHLRTAVRHLEAAEYWRASRHLNKAQRTDPKSALPLIYQGLADLKQGNLRAANESFDRARARGGGWIAPLGRIVVLYRRKRPADADEAMHILTLGLPRPHPVHAYYLARRAMEKGDVNGAEYFLGAWK